MALYNFTPNWVSAPRGPEQGERTHETCAQDVIPDGRFVLHVHGAGNASVVGC